MKSTILSLLIFWSFNSFAQENLMVPQLRSGSGFLFSPDPDLPSFVHNAIDESQYPVLQFGHQRHYLSSELASTQMILSAPVKRTYCTFLYNRFGYNVSHQSILRFHSAMKLDDNWSFGLSAGFWRSSIGQEKPSKAHSFGVSSYYLLSKTICLGSYLQYSGDVQLNLGARFTLSDKATCYLENQIAANFSSLSAQLVYKLVSVWHVFLGYRSLPARPSMGVLFHLDRLLINFNSEFHPHLGFQSLVSIAFHLRKEDA